MDKIARNLRATQREAEENIRRAKENFVKPERIVEAFNLLHPFRTNFTMTPGSTVLLSLRITDFPIPCTVNPPVIDVRTTTNFGGDNPGQIGAILSNTYNVDPPNPDFTLVSASLGLWRTGIVVPVDGCYSVLWLSSAWGVGYIAGKVISVGIVHNDAIVRTVEQTNTWELHLLGPTIYSYAPASPVWAVVEAKAGDIISAFLTQEDISEHIPWYNGTGLGGFFYSPYDSTSITVELIAVAEAQP